MDAQPGGRSKNRPCAYRVDGQFRWRISQRSGCSCRRLATYAHAYPEDPYASESTKVKAVVDIYGHYDAIAQWQHDVLTRPTDNITENFMGFPPMQNRLAWYAASPVAYASFANNNTSFLLVWGTNDDIVEPSSQSEAFLLALKQARFYARTVIIQSAPHFWIADPVDEPNSFTGFFAPRLLRFLTQRL